MEKPLLEKHLEPVPCPRCGNLNDATLKYCGYCSMILDEKEAQEVMVKETFFTQLDEFLKENPEKVKKFKDFLKEL